MRNEVVPSGDSIIAYRRIRLERAELLHLSAWKTFMQDPEVMRFIFGGWLPDDAEVSELLIRNSRIWKRYSMGWWSVKEQQSGEIIANAVLDVSCTGPSEIGYIIKKSHWRRGFGMEIVKTICRYAFDDADIPSLKAYVNLENEGSIKVLERLGFRRLSEASFSGRPCIQFVMTSIEYPKTPCSEE